VLNSKTVDGREKPIISALEYIREYLMKRIVNVIKVIQKCNGPLTPSVAKQFDVIKSEATKCVVEWSGGKKWQVNSPGREQVVVDIESKECSCRKWDLTGIPCRHAVAVIYDMALNGMDVGPPESFVNECYYLQTWRKVYSNHIVPVIGPSMWQKSNLPTQLTPPLHHTPIGRPKKKRARDAVEIQDELEKGGKMTRKWKTVTCAKCKKRDIIQGVAKGRGVKVILFKVVQVQVARVEKGHLKGADHPRGVQVLLMLVCMVMKGGLQLLVRMVDVVPAKPPN
jgi:hypothetical protein